MSKRHLPTKPPSEQFGILEGDWVYCVTRAEAEQAMKHWQAQIDAGKEPDGSKPIAIKIYGLDLDETLDEDGVELTEKYDKKFAEQAAEIERLKAIKSPAEHGREGWKQRQESSPSQEPSWRPYVRSRIVNAPAPVRNSPHPKIYEWLRDSWTFRERECPGRTVLMEFLSKLREERVLPSSRRK